MVSVLFLSACAPERLDPPAERADAIREAADVEIVFSDDWTVTQSGPIIQGATVRVSYDPDRLTRCRGRKYGQEAWAINGVWQIDGGATQYFPVVTPSMPAVSTFVADTPGTLEMWFENSDAFGCVAYDSDFGENYVFEVEPLLFAPDWVGNASSVISRATCGDGGPCSADFRPLAQGFVYDTWARQRAAIRSLYFQVWEPGVTDFDNADLWQDLDARVYWRFASEDAFRWDWVPFDRRVGNDARYAVSLRQMDPLPGNTVTDPADCPSFPLELTPDGQYVQVDVELYFEVNGVALRPDDGGVYLGRFQDYAGPYAACL